VAFENRYGLAQRVLHRLAFHSGGLQVSLADIEDRLHASRLEGASAAGAVFVTALPRAGTTLLLDLLVESGLFASHTYRDMPFVLCPLIWSQLAGGFRAEDEARERAHGDGMLVSADSPEAFEEMIWRQFWPGHYRAGSIVPWTTCDDPEFVDFFTRHMRKIVALRSGEGEARRYASKNNANVARLGALLAMLPDARIVVPFRDPVQHAASLLAQHLRFLETHAADPFARAYMKGIGHYDFGENLKPIDFGSWLQTDRRQDARALAFWIEYWTAAYEHVLDQLDERVLLVSYDRLTADPRPNLARIAGFLEIEDTRLAVFESRFRPPRAHSTDTSGVKIEALDAARALHARLEKRAQR
jgi:hypothetical protein